jgi:hypothetical protein
MDEKCRKGQIVCVLTKADIANDWTHGNSVALAPDGNIIYSCRHLDWVIKIAYQNGSGDGHVIWRLGKDGDFSYVTNNNDPYPWATHTHDAEYESANVISIYDNGNTRHDRFQLGNSRGQVLQLNEGNRTATVLLNQDLGAYSSALGSAQRLSNGNYVFDSGFIVAPNRAQSVETGSTGGIVSRVDVNDSVYRTWRLRDLYTVTW